MLNVALFVPAGFAWALVRGRPFVVWLGLTGLALLIELTQGLTGLGALWLVALRRGARPRPRTLLIRGALIALGLAAVFTFATVGADRVRHGELVDLYGASSYQSVQALGED